MQLKTIERLSWKRDIQCWYNNGAAAHAQRALSVHPRSGRLISWGQLGAADKVPIPANFCAAAAAAAVNEEVFLDFNLQETFAIIIRASSWRHVSTCSSMGKMQWKFYGSCCGEKKFGQFFGWNPEKNAAQHQTTSVCCFFSAKAAKVYQLFVADLLAQGRVLKFFSRTYKILGHTALQLTTPPSKCQFSKE